MMVTVGQQGYLKENLTELHIIVRTTGLNCITLMIVQMYCVDKEVESFM